MTLTSINDIIKAIILEASMLKNFFSALLVSVLLLSTINISTFASQKTSEVSAPGGNVSTPEELIAALGGKGISYENGVISIIKDITLSSSINITSGSYTVTGEGAIIKGSFSGDLFVLTGEGTTLVIGDRTAPMDRTNLVLDGENTIRAGSAFRVESGARLEICNTVVIKNFATSTSGAVIYNLGELTVYGGEIENARASSLGGAIYNEGTMTLASGTIKNCSANDGGAVYTKGKSSFIAVEMSNNNAISGGAIYNEGEMQFLATTLTACSASKGGGIYNSGKAVVSGGTIHSNKAENGDGGGIYNANTLDLSGSVLRENSAKNGGNLYNTDTVTTGEGFSLSNGIATEKGGNIYNSELGKFTQSYGSITLGSAVYGGGIYNLGTVNLAQGGVYANKAEVGEGILNHGRLVLTGYGYCERGDDIFVVLTPENEHAIVISDGWVYKAKPVSVSCGIFSDGKYSYSHSLNDKLLDIKGSINVGERFMLHVGNTGLTLSNEGTLVKAKTQASDTVIFVICSILAYPLVTLGIVALIRYFDKKKLKSETEKK